MGNRTLSKKGLLVVVLTAAICFLLWNFIPKPSFWVLDNGIKFQGARSLAETGELRIQYNGSDFDPNMHFRPLPPPFTLLEDGRQIPVFSPLFSLIAAYFFRLFGSTGPFLLPLLGGIAVLLSCWMLWRKLRGDHDGRLFIAAVGFATPLLFYSLTLWEHSLATAFFIFALALLFPRSDREIEDQYRWAVLVSGVFVGISTGFRTEMLILAVIFPVLWKLTGRLFRDLLLFGSGLVVSLAGVGFLNWFLTGTVIPLHIIANGGYVWNSGLQSILSRIPDNLFLLLFAGLRDLYISLGLSAVIVFTGLWIGWRKRWMWSILLGLSITFVWFFYMFTAWNSPDRASYMMRSGGLFWVMPVTLLALLPLRSTRFSRYKKFIWWSVLLFIGLVAIFAPVIKGVHWGPRMLLPTMPLIILMALSRVQRWWSKYKPARLLVIILLGITVIGQLYSVWVLRDTRIENERLNRWITSLPTDEKLQAWALSSGQEATLTNMWWFAGDAALHSDRSPWYLTESPDGLSYVINSLRKRGEIRFIFFERPPYIPDDLWWRFGVEVKGRDYFLGSEERVRRNWMRIYP